MSRAIVIRCTLCVAAFIAALEITRALIEPNGWTCEGRSDSGECLAWTCRGDIDACWWPEAARKPRRIP